MQLEGSCHCGAVRFTVESHAPQPFLYCYCSICRKVGGGNGSAVNIMGEAATLSVTGSDRMVDYHVRHPDREPGETSTAHRFFCGSCGAALWAANERYPQWIYPFASAIDTPLPAPPERIHMMTDSAAPWVRIPDGANDVTFADYPDESLEAWHRRHGLWE